MDHDNDTAFLDPTCTLVFCLRLQPGCTSRMRRAFQRRLERESARLGLVTVQHRGLQLWTGAQHPLRPEHRHALLNWLVDQPEPATVWVNWPQPIGRLLNGSALDPELQAAKLLAPLCLLLARLAWGLLMRLSLAQPSKTQLLAWLAAMLAHARSPEAPIERGLDAQGRA